MADTTVAQNAAAVARAEHPRPDLYRERWLCLNGEWEFEVDNAERGHFAAYWNRAHLDGKIRVPFCPESALSGVGNTDFMHCVWYRREIVVPPSFAGYRVLLHFGAVDYHARVYVNGRFVGEHRGGYTPFSLDITDALNPAGNVLTVSATDHLRDERQVCGKQSTKLESYGCYYTRTTGIWQSVWLEAVHPARVLSYRAYPDIHNASVALTVRLTEAALGKKLSVRALYDGRPVGEADTPVASRAVTLTLPLSERHLWDVGQGELYELEFTLSDGGTVCDALRGYFGLREIGLTKRGLTVNGRTVFGRFVLDQGFYPDGIYTAPTDDALRADIENAQRLGFNGARLHQKVFEPRFLYWADKLGYLVWEETGNWGLDHTDPMNLYHFLPEWQEQMERDFSHPSVIGWCPFNETWDRPDGRRQSQELLNTVVAVTRAVDPTRPVIATSGGFPADTDIHDVHDYEQDPKLFRENYAHIREGVVHDQLYRMFPKRQVYNPALPVFVSEYGGIRWVVDGDGSGWGYGKSVTAEEEFIARFRGLTEALLDNPDVIALCYTQLTDVEQEQNGLMTYQRAFKFPPEIFRQILSRPAANEKADGSDDSL